MKQVVLVLALAGCLRSSPPRQQPLGCGWKVYELQQRCDQAKAQRQPELLVEMLRSELTTFAPTCIGNELAPVEQCVASLEASFATGDPDRTSRRATAATRVDATRAKPQYKALLADLFEVRDRIEIQCRRRSLSVADERECQRWEQRGTDVANRLEAFLHAEGYDHRDYNAFDLWPGGAITVQR